MTKQTGPPIKRHCCNCEWCVDGRCCFNPPQVRLPYDNMSSWPVVSKHDFCSHFRVSEDLLSAKMAQMAAQNLT